MPPKKGKKGKAEAEPKELLPEIDKAFFELEIADLNRKLERLKTYNAELETRNEELEAEYKKLDEDRADVITYLKKTLQIKVDEVAELTERVQAIEEKRQAETKDFQGQMKDLKKEFNVMRETLTSEVKMLSGKLNSLEEFRAQRDNLMAQFEAQEANYASQELHYKKILHETEKKFIVSKDNLKKELESRLLKLAQDFQDATEIRIASSTHRVIRENIAVNNELREVLSIQASLSDQNTSLKERERSARLALQLAEEQRDTAMEKSLVQLNLIQRLSKEHLAMKDKITLIRKAEFDFATQARQIEKLTTEISKMGLKVRILEQNLHVSLCEKSELKMSSLEAKGESDRLKDVIVSASLAVKGAIKISDCPLDDSEAEKDAARRNLLKRLLDLLSVPGYVRARSLSTVPSAAAVYRRGDLGFVPKDESKSSICSSYQSSIIKSDSIETKRRSTQIYKGESLKTIYSKMIIPAIGSQEEVIGHLGEGDIDESEEEGEEEESIRSEEVEEVIAEIPVKERKTRVRKGSDESSDEGSDDGSNASGDEREISQDKLDEEDEEEPEEVADEEKPEE